MPVDREFTVNEYITLKLENGKSTIYVDGKEFLQCKIFLLTIPIEEYPSIEEITLIFWGHCSNFQAWAENNYILGILDSNISFPLLKKLTELGDPIAPKAFSGEIINRLKTGNLTVVESLLQDSYLSFLSNKEISNLILYWLDMENFSYEIYEQLMEHNVLTDLNNKTYQDKRSIKEFFLHNLTSGNVITLIKNAFVYKEKDSWEMVYHFLNDISWKCVETFKIALRTISLNCSSIWLNEFFHKKDERILNSLSKMISNYYIIIHLKLDFYDEYYYLLDQHVEKDHDIRKLGDDFLDRVFNPKKNYSKKDIFTNVKRIAKKVSVDDIYSLFNSGILLHMDKDQLMLLEFSLNIFEIINTIHFESGNDYEDFINTILWNCNTEFRNTLIREVFEGQNNEAISFIIENEFLKPFFSSEFFLTLPKSSLRKVIRNLINSFGFVFENDASWWVENYLNQISEKGESYQKILSEETFYLLKHAPIEVVEELMGHYVYKFLNKNQLLALFAEQKLLDKAYNALNTSASYVDGIGFIEIHLGFYNKSLEVVPEEAFIKLFHDEKRREQITSDLLHNYLCCGALRDDIGIRVLEIIAKHYNTPTEIFEINFDGETCCFIIYGGNLDIHAREFVINKFSQKISKLEEVDLSKINYQNLRHLTIGHTKIRDIRAIKGIDKLVNLKELRLFSNEIEEIKDMDAFINLNVLSLGWQIREIKGLEKLVNLEKLFLGKQIEEIKGLEELKNLKTLSLVGNKIKKINGLENLSSLKELNLSNNQIEEIEGVEKLKNLEKLNLTKNRLRKVDIHLESLPNLTELILSHNDIKDIKSSSVLKRLEQRGVKVYF